MVKIITTNEVSEYLKPHEIAICNYAAQCQIPAIRIGRVCQFDKDVIDDWIRTGQNEPETDKGPQKKNIRNKQGKKKTRK